MVAAAGAHQRMVGAVYLLAGPGHMRVHRRVIDSPRRGDAAHEEAPGRGLVPAHANRQLSMTLPQRSSAEIQPSKPPARSPGILHQVRAPMPTQPGAKIAETVCIELLQKPHPSLNSICAQLSPARVRLSSRSGDIAVGSPRPLSSTDASEASTDTRKPPPEAASCSTAAR